MAPVASKVAETLNRACPFQMAGSRQRLNFGPGRVLASAKIDALFVSEVETGPSPLHDRASTPTQSLGIGDCRLTLRASTEAGAIWLLQGLFVSL